MFRRRRRTRPTPLKGQTAPVQQSSETAWPPALDYFLSGKYGTLEDAHKVFPLECYSPDHAREQLALCVAQGWLTRQRVQSGWTYHITPAGADAYQRYWYEHEQRNLQQALTRGEPCFLGYVHECHFRSREATMPGFLSHFLVYWRQHINPELIAGMNSDEIDNCILQRLNTVITNDVGRCLKHGWIRRIGDYPATFQITSTGISLVQTHLRTTRN